MAKIKQKILVTIDPDDYELVRAAAHADRARSINQWVCMAITMVARTMKVQPGAEPTFMGKPIKSDEFE